MSRRVERAKARIREEKRKRLMRILAVVLIITFIVSSICYQIIKYKREMSIGYKLIDWDNIAYEIGDVDVVEPIGGVVTQDSYHKVRMSASAKELLKFTGVLPKEFYDNFVEGIQSEYYKDIVYSEYSETVKEIRDLLAQSEYILQMYNDYRGLEGFKDFEACHSDTCLLKTFIDSYTGNELHEYLIDVHNKWESLVEYQMSRVQVDDDTLDMFYQEEIITNMDYLENISVDVYIVNSYLLDNKDLLNKLYDKGKIPKVTLGIENKESLKALSLYKSTKFYDENIIDLAAPTFSKISDGQVIDNVINLTGETDLEQAIKGIEPPKPVSKKSILDMPNVKFSLLNRSNEDIIAIYYDIKSIKHVDNIPSREELLEYLEYKAKVYLAELDINDEITTRIKDDMGDNYSTEEDHDHDHDGDGIPDH